MSCLQVSQASRRGHLESLFVPVSTLNQRVLVDPFRLNLRWAAADLPISGQDPVLQELLPCHQTLLGSALGHMVTPVCLCPACSGTSSRPVLPRPWDKHCSSTGA